MLVEKNVSNCSSGFCYLELTLMRVEMLSDMHDKLSQAVKLYDSILTDQVRYCSSHSPPQQFQQQQRIPSSSNKYNRWTPVSFTSQVTSQQYVPPSQPLMQRHSPPRSPVSALQHVSSSPIQSTLQRSQSLVSASHSPQHHVYAPVPPPGATIVSTPQSQPQTSSQFISHRPLVSYVSAPQHQRGVHLGRSSTVAHPGYQSTLQSSYQQVHQQPRQQESKQPPQVQYQKRELSSTLPQFPLVPTAAPMCDSAIHSRVLQSEERKEAMLIDL